MLSFVPGGTPAWRMGSGLRSLEPLAQRDAVYPICRVTQAPTTPISSHTAAIDTCVMSNNFAWHDQRESVHFLGLRSVRECVQAWNPFRARLAGGLPELVGGQFSARRENDTQKTGNDENFTVVMCCDPHHTHTFCACHCVRHGAAG